MTEFLRPEMRYATTKAGVHIGYQIVGDGPTDLMFLPGVPVPLDLAWEEPGFARFARRLATFSRAILSDQGGLRAPDGAFGVGAYSDAEHTAVLDDAGCREVVFVGEATSGVQALHYTATNPERVSALILVNSFAYYGRDDDYRIGLDPETMMRYATVLWGTGQALTTLAPSRVSDERFRQWWARCERLSVGANPRGLLTSLKTDLRFVLPTITVPTLVLHRRGNRFIRCEAGRYLADRIPGARYVELPGDDALFFAGDVDALVDEIEEFLTGTRQAPEGDVVMATVLFTDIVNSTAQQATMGHRGWSTVLEQHDHMVRAALQRYRGREVKTTGDGFLATFDGASRAVRCATEIVREAAALGIEVRAGLHGGEIELRGDDISGLAVAICKRVCDLAGPGQVLVSSALPPMVAGSDIEFEDRGVHELKGVPGTWRLYEVEG